MYRWKLSSVNVPSLASLGMEGRGKKGSLWLKLTFGRFHLHMNVDKNLPHPSKKTTWLFLGVSGGYLICV